MSAFRFMGTFRTVAVVFVMALAVAVSLGATISSVGAEPKTNGSVADRTQSQRDICETIGGGKLAVQESLDGTSNTTECKGGDFDGRTCFNTPKSTTCQNKSNFQNVTGSRLGDDIVWQEVSSNEQPAPFETNAGGDNRAPAGSDVESVEPDPAATPVIVGPEVAADDPVDAEPEPTSTPEDETDNRVPGTVADEPLVADDASTDDSSGDEGSWVVDHVAGDFGDIQFFDDQQQ